jgi:TonB family protein
MRALVILLLLLPKLCAAQLAPAGGNETGRGRSLTPGGHIPLRNVDVLSDTQGLDLTPYLRLNTHFVHRNWQKLTTPEVIGSSHAVSELAVEFTVSRDGSLSGAKLVQPSGDSVLDKAALEAVGRASPFAELPSSYAGQLLALRVHLHYDPNWTGPTEQSLQEHFSAIHEGAELEHAGHGPVPKAIYTPDPEFTEEARRKKVEGVVLLKLTVSEDGDVTDAVVTKGLGYGLDEKALEAVHRWKFKPPLKDGQPTSSTADVEVNFHLY